MTKSKVDFILTFYLLTTLSMVACKVAILIANIMCKNEVHVVLTVKRQNSNKVQVMTKTSVYEGLRYFFLNFVVRVGRN